jgi:hypothetical protein
VARLAGDIELAAQRRHLLPFEQAGDKTQPLVHLLTLLPGHLRLPQKPKSVSDVPGILCNPCTPKHTATLEKSLYPLLYPLSEIETVKMKTLEAIALLVVTTAAALYLCRAFSAYRERREQRRVMERAFADTPERKLRGC